MSKEQEPIWNSKAGDPEQDPLYYDKTNSPRVVSDFNLFIQLKAHPMAELDFIVGRWH